MTKEIRTLIEECSAALVEREYGFCYSRKLAREWDRIADWCDSNGIAVFDQAACLGYCDSSIGSRVVREGMAEDERIRLRAARMLLSFGEGGEFEFRSPRVDHTMRGESAVAFGAYLDHEVARGLSPKTIDNKRWFLWKLNAYLEERGIAVRNVGADEVEGFLNDAAKTPASRHNASQHLRHLLRWLFDEGVIDRDVAACVPRDAYRRRSELPATYTGDEVASVLAAVDRSSATGRRDYVVLLLAAEYGLRSGDIVSLELGDIDWERNVITVRQSKTKAVVELPLLACVGNAIIDYVRHGRPDCDLPQLVLSAGRPATARPITSPTVHSIVSKHLARAGVDGWERKKHGAHSLRHSLAVRMLGTGAPLPAISEVLGHQGTDQTAGYLGLDAASLVACALPAPRMRSPHYGEAAS